MEIVARVVEHVEDELLREAEAEGGELVVESSVISVVRGGFEDVADAVD